MIARTTRSSAISRDAAALTGGRGVGGIRSEAPAAQAPGLFVFDDDPGPHQGQQGSVSTLCITRARPCRPGRPIGFLHQFPEDMAMAKKGGGKKGGGKGKKGC